MDLLPKNILYNGSNTRIIDIDGPAINYNTFLNTKEEDGSYYTIFVGLYSIPHNTGESPLNSIKLS